MTKTIAITTLGCKINQFESAAMTQALEEDGFSIVPFSGPADIYLINSCTVTAKTDAEGRALLVHLGMPFRQATPTTTTTTAVTTTGATP